MVRQCVRNEIALQRSGNNSSLLMRTRDLIANSASREVTNGIGPSELTGAVNLPGISSSSAGQNSVGTAEACLRSRQSYSFQTSAKRTASATNQHPWRFKKSKQKSAKQEFNPRAIHLLDIAEKDDKGFVPDYTVTEDIVLLKGLFELGTVQSEKEIRESITEVLKQRFPFVRPDHFDFVKRERNKVATPVVSKSLEWNYKHVKELCGQGKLYVRLNVPKECIDRELNCELSAVEDEELMKSPFSNANEAERATVTTSLECRSSRNIPSNTDEVFFVGACNSPSLVTDAAKTSSSQSDVATLRELVPSASEEEIGNALLEYGGLDSAANSLLRETSAATSLAQIIDVLGQKLTGKRKKLDVDQDDMIQDAVAFYKSTNFDPCSPLRIAYKGQPAIDGGCVLRQFYTDLFQGIIDGQLMVLFEGENNRKLPSYQPQATSGLKWLMQCKNH